MLYLLLKSEYVVAVFVVVAFDISIAVVLVVVVGGTLNFFCRLLMALVQPSILCLFLIQW